MNFGKSMLRNILWTSIRSCSRAQHSLVTGLKTAHSYRFFNLKVFGMRLVRTFQSLVKLKRYVVLLLEQKKKIDLT